ERCRDRGENSVGFCIARSARIWAQIMNGMRERKVVNTAGYVGFQDWGGVPEQRAFAGRHARGYAAGTRAAATLAPDGAAASSSLVGLTRDRARMAGGDSCRHPNARRTSN